MRTRLSISLFAALLLTLVPCAGAQDANKIIDQYLKASGGSRNISKIQTLSLEGTFSNPSDEKSGAYTFNTKFPNRYYSELTVGEKSTIEAYNGKSAWHQISGGEIATLTGTEGFQLEAAGQYYNSRLTNLKKNKLLVAFIGHAQVQGKDALQIEVTTPNNLKRRIFFDPVTHLIVKESATIGGINQEQIYDDYRPVNGIRLPHKIELHRGNQIFQITITRAFINKTIGERVFDFPKKSQIVLPDLKALFTEIDENQKAIDKIKENYAGTRNEEETEYEKDGKLKKVEQKEFTFFYLNGEEVSTLVKKDGKPLNEEEQQKENKKTQDEIKDIQHRKEKKDAKEEKAKEEGKENERDDPGIEVFLRASQFVNPRRERFRGEDVLVFDFEPNPEFKPHKLSEKVIQKLAGVVWIDEKAHDVVRLEAYFTDNMKVGGGMLANLQKGTSFVFEQAFYNNEVWLPTYAEIHIGVRVLLVKGIKVNEVIRYSDYKKFNVDTISNISKPKGTDVPSPAEKPSAPQP